MSCRSSVQKVDAPGRRRNLGRHPELDVATEPLIEAQDVEGFGVDPQPALAAAADVVGDAVVEPLHHLDLDGGLGLQLVVDADRRPLVDAIQAGEREGVVVALFDQQHRQRLRLGGLLLGRRAGAIVVLARRPAVDLDHLPPGCRLGAAVLGRDPTTAAAPTPRCGRRRRGPVPSRAAGCARSRGTPGSARGRSRPPRARRRAPAWSRGRETRRSARPAARRRRTGRDTPRALRGQTAPAGIGWAVTRAWRRIIRPSRAGRYVTM